MSLPDFFIKRCRFHVAFPRDYKKKTCSWKEKIFSDFTLENEDSYYFALYSNYIHDNFFYKCVSCSLGLLTAFFHYIESKAHAH